MSRARPDTYTETFMPARTIRVPTRAALDFYATGWWGAPERKGSIVHVKVKGERWPVCGARFHDDMRFQFCAHGAREDYVECRSCVRILGLKPPVAGAAA